MNDMTDVLKAIEASDARFQQFQKSQEERFHALEAKEAKANRPDLTRGEVPEESKAFNEYIKAGGVPEWKSYAISTNAGADGGNTVPKYIENAIDAVAVQQGSCLSLVRSVDSFTSDYHVIVQNSRNANSWVAETAARPSTTTAQFTDIKPVVGELFAFPQLTQQLISDAGFNIDNFVTQRVGEEFGAAIETAILTGSGVNQPAGILTSTFVATSDATRTFGQLEYVPTGVAGDWAATNKADILFTLLYRLKAAYRKNASWLMHPSVMMELLSFKDSQGKYLIQTAQVQGEPPTLLGKPIFESEMMPVKAASSLSVLVGDFSRAYVFVNRTPTTILRDAFSNKPYIGLYTTRRVGGAVTNSEAVKALKFSVS